MLKKARMRLGVLLALSVVALCVWVVVLASGHTSTSAVLRVAFFDVGQGDSIFIESPTGTQVLVDGGQGAGVLRALSREMGFFDRTIDVVVATHPDLDHIGGLVDVLERYDVATVVTTENTGETTTANVFYSDVAREGADVVYARRGTRIDLGAGAYLEILFPDRDPAMLESNTASIVARVVYGEHEFLLTGDSPQSIEEHLVVLGKKDLASDVLKVGHHGSRTSTSALFLDAVNPTFAVISAGRDNRYGHPHKEVLDALASEGAEIFSTAEAGTIVFESDGSTIERVR